MSDEIPEINPKQAAQRCRDDQAAVIIDVRSKVEYEFVGHPIGAIHIAWKEFPDWEENPNFCAQVDAALESDGDARFDRPLLMLCRSGARSMAAGKKLAAHGYTNVANIAEGFEGDKDAANHRGNINGWRFHRLPWEQG